jgi:hypothetical protein
MKNNKTYRHGVCGLEHPPLLALVSLKIDWYPDVDLAPPIDASGDCEHWGQVTSLLSKVQRSEHFGLFLSTSRRKTRGPDRFNHVERGVTLRELLVQLMRSMVLAVAEVVLMDVQLVREFTELRNFYFISGLLWTV